MRYHLLSGYTFSHFLIFFIFQNHLKDDISDGKKKLLKFSNQNITLHVPLALSYELLLYMETIFIHWI